MEGKETLTIQINDVEYQARQGQMLIEVADANNIDIPRFCYHKKLSVSANCRMCLVEVERAPKMLPACATPVTDGMKAWTKSPKAIAAQKSVMEFLLINHPLDCPVCDQGGECDLQEFALGYGDHSARYQERKRIVKDKDYGSLVSTEMTRCIHCTRCVRFGTEIAGVTEIGGTGRGDHMEIGTYVQRSLRSELSGNIIDLCPVGALLSKPFLYTARSWELNTFPSIAPHDAVGSNIDIQTRNGEVMRVIPRENEAINEIWLSDRDRFSYLGLSSEDRATQPMIRNESGKLVPCDWEQALELGVKKLQEAAGDLGALASPSSTVEEFYLLQKLVRGLGSSSIDFRLGQQDFSGQLQQVTPRLSSSLQEVETLDAALLVGSNLHHEQPLLAHRLRKAAQAGGRISSIHTADSAVFNFPLQQQVESERLTTDLAAMAKVMVSDGRGDGLDKLIPLVADVEVDDSHQTIANALIEADSTMIILGEQAYRDQNQSILYMLAVAICEMSGAGLSVLTEGANVQGGTVAGALPFKQAGGENREGVGPNIAEMVNQPPKAMLLMGVEAEDISPAVAEALGECDFVIALTPFVDSWLGQHADLVLPMAAFTETSGTYVNMEGLWQSFQGVVPPKGEARPGWKILRVLGTMADLDGFEWNSSEAIRDEVKQLSESIEPGHPEWHAPESLGDRASSVEKGKSIYRTDPLVRRSEALQQSYLGLQQEDVA